MDDDLKPDTGWLPEALPGTRWSNNDPAVDAAIEQRQRAAGRNRPGSIYYRNAPPDEDDYWRWCHQCQCWHSHDPCF